MRSFLFIVFDILFNFVVRGVVYVFTRIKLGGSILRRFSKKKIKLVY